MINVVATIK